MKTLVTVLAALVLILSVLILRSNSAPTRASSSSCQAIDYDALAGKMSGFRIHDTSDVIRADSLGEPLVVAPNGEVYSFTTEVAGKAFQHFVDEAIAAGCPIAGEKRK